MASETRRLLGYIVDIEQTILQRQFQRSHYLSLINNYEVIEGFERFLNLCKKLVTRLEILIGYHNLHIEALKERIHEIRRRG